MKAYHSGAYSMAVVVLTITIGGLFGAGAFFFYAWDMIMQIANNC